MLSIVYHTLRLYESLRDLLAHFLISCRVFTFMFFQAKHGTTTCKTGFTVSYASVHHQFLIRKERQTNHDV